MTSTTRLQCDVLYRNWTNDDEFSLLFLNLDKDLNNSIPGKIAHICRTERLQINVITFERTQIISSSSLLQFSNDHDDNDDDGDSDEEDKDDDDDDNRELKHRRRQRQRKRQF